MTNLILDTDYKEYMTIGGRLIRIAPKRFRRGRATATNGRTPRYKYHIARRGKG